MNNKEMRLKAYEIVKSIVLCKPEYRKIYNYKDALIVNTIERLEAKDIHPDKIICKYLVPLFMEIDFEEHYDEEKASFTYYFIQMLYFKILNKNQTVSRDVDKKDKLYDKIGESAYEDALTFIDNLESTETRPYLARIGADISSQTYSPEDDVYEKEMVQVVREYYGKEVFDMRVKGFKSSAIAEELGKKTEAVRKFLHRRKLGLIKHLEKCGFCTADLPDAIITKLGG